MSIAGHVLRAMLSRYSRVRMEAKRRAFRAHTKSSSSLIDLSVVIANAIVGTGAVEAHTAIVIAALAVKIGLPELCKDESRRFHLCRMQRHTSALNRFFVICFALISPTERRNDPPNSEIISTSHFDSLQERIPNMATTPSR
jgi:hypothetical protein